MAIEWPNWCRGSLAPDEVIGGHAMLRWWLIKSRRFAIYVHKHTGDDPRTPHDHPADNVSIRIKGRVREFVPAELELSVGIARLRGEGHVSAVMHEGNAVYFTRLGRACMVSRDLARFTFRRAEQAHRLEASATGPAWTIWIRGPVRREWGYYEPGGWRPAVTKHQPALNEASKAMRDMADRMPVAERRVSSLEAIQCPHGIRRDACPFCAPEWR